MSKKVVFVTRNSYPSIMYELLKEKFEVIFWESKKSITKPQFIENIKGKFGVICYPPDMCRIDRDIIEAAGQDLKVISTHSVGYNHLDIEELKSRGIRIGYVPDVSTEAVAEYAIAILLAISRRVLQGDSCVRKGEWSGNYWNLMWLCGLALNFSTVSIVGCGRIGLSVMKKLKSFEPSRIFYYSRSHKEKADEFGAELKSLDYIMKESDFVIISLPLNEKTSRIINEEMITLMKPNAILVNIGRGKLIDENALIKALQERKIAGAALDVFDEEPLPLNSPLLKLDNVVLTPHRASCTNESRDASARIAALNVLAVLNNEKMPAEL